jgi:phage gpG-like protein
MTDLILGVGNLKLPTLKNPSPLLRQWAAYLDSIAITAFKSETSPSGQKWAALSPAYQKRRKSKFGRKKLKVTGALFDTLAAQVEPTGVRIQSNLRVGSYSLGAIHQFGAPRRKIPARPFLPLDTEGELLPETREKLVDLARTYFFDR